MPALVAHLAAAVADYPQRIALVEGARSLSYARLWQQAGACADALRAAGVQPGDRVALILPNRLEAVIAWYGVWRAGGVVVPLNAQARLRDFTPWLAHCGARAVVYEAGHGDAIAAIAAQAPAPASLAVPPADALTDSVQWFAHDRSETDGATHGDADATAAILYTSGTTGAPKGVLLSHGNLAANAESIVAYQGLSASDSTVTVLPFYYAFGASVLHTHLAVGARVVLETNTVFPHLITEALARERATGFSGVPSTYALLLDRGQLDAYDLSALRYLAQAGGAMSPALTRRVRVALPQARLFVMYGQTEASARLTWLPPERVDDKLGSVGIAIPGVEIQVRREDGTIAAPDEAGEVCARGPNIMRGYWQAPEASAMVLRNGWLHTGDIGRLDAEGYLWLAGRRSDMIKTGAHRVHPQDVEEAIAELAGVREVAVAGIDDELLGQTVAAWIVADAQAGLNELKVKAHCRERLAIYKIPKRVAFLEQLPKTASGKIRRADLAARTADHDA